MSALYGYLQGSRGQATCQGHKTITASVQTWTHRITVNLDADGTYSVILGPGPQGNVKTRTLSAGNVNDN